MMWEAWTGLIWLRIRTNGGLLQTQSYSLCFCKVQEISLLAGKLLLAYSMFQAFAVL